MMAFSRKVKRYAIKAIFDFPSTSYYLWLRQARRSTGPGVKLRQPNVIGYRKTLFLWNETLAGFH